MRTIEVNIYKFDELTEEAKERAIEKWRETTQENNDYAWSGENKETLKAFEKIFPVKIKDWAYGSGYRDGVSYEFTESDEVKDLYGWRLATYIWNNYGSYLYKGKYYGDVKANKIVRHKRIKNPKAFDNGNFFNPYYSAITLDYSCVLTGYCLDDDILGSIYEFLDKPNEANFEDLLNDCFDAWVKACNADREYQDSDEAIIETIQANDYEFTEDGELF